MRFAFIAAYSLSAACALALELVWMRTMAAALGSTALANACVLGGFMAGLCAGSLAGAQLAARVSRPMRAFGLAQLAGAVAAFGPWALARAVPGLSLAAGTAAVMACAWPLGLAFALATQVRSADGSGKGGRPAVLYAADAAGATAGCLLTGLVLVERLGLLMSIVVAAGIKGLYGLTCLVAGGLDSYPHIERARSGRPPAVLLLAVAAQGAALLGAEAIWSRILPFVLFRGSTTYALTSMLAAVVGASSLGALWAGRCKPERAAVLASRSALLCCAGLCASLAGLLIAAPRPTGGALGASDLLVTLVLCGPASFFSGAVFAAACRACGEDPGGQQAGWLLGLNALGALLGSLGALLVAGALGLSGALMAFAGLPALGAVCISLGFGRQRQAALISCAACGLLLAGAGLAALGPVWADGLGPVVYYAEGPASTVAVVEEQPGVRRLYVDNIAVAGTDLAMQTDQKALAHLPLLLHGHARSVLTVGFGSGGTSYSLLLHLGLARVDCVEIEQAVLGAAKRMADARGGAVEIEDERFHLHLADARRFLQLGDRRYDVIVHDCTDLAYRGDASVYTRDFFRLVRARLAPGGLAAAWLPLRGQPPFRSLRAVAAGFADVFPHSALWVFDACPLHFGILCGSERPIAMDLDAVARRLDGSDALRADLAAVGLEDPARLAASIQLDDLSLRRWIEGATRHTDDRPVAEFWAAGESGADASTYDLLRALGPAVPALGATVRSDPGRAALARRIQARPWLLAGHAAWLDGREALARHLYIRALRIDPADALPRSLLGLRSEASGLERAIQDWMAGRAGRAVEQLAAIPGRGALRSLVEALALLDLARPAEAAELLGSLAAEVEPGLRGATAVALWRSRLPGWLGEPVGLLTSGGL
ncbi:MAG: fused MFS/spermidine synthase [Deltaproteobacteria bacterium]|nr:fused MFS/spermidine synthase [Deltaproteobacteria bacterium]